MRRRSPDRSIRSRFPRAAWLLACAIALGAVAIACGRDESTPAAPPAASGESAQPAAPPTPAAPGSPAGEAPAAPGEAAPDNAVTSEGVIPEGYPSDVPVYPGATPG